MMPFQSLEEDFDTTVDSAAGTEDRDAESVGSVATRTGTVDVGLAAA